MRQGSKMTRGRFGRYLWLAFLLGLPVIFFGQQDGHAQSVKDLPPPPAPWKAKPTPTPKPPEQEVLDVVRVTSNLVMVPVSVTNNQGQPIQGLQVKDFRLQEEGKEQEIAEIGNPEQIPLDIAILFDISSSVSQKGFFEFQQNAAAAFLRLVLKPVDRAAVFTIAAEPTLVQPLASAEVAAKKIVSVPSATKSVPTAFYDTVTAAAKYLLQNSPSRNRRVIVVISDGDDNFSERVRDLSLAQYNTQRSDTKAAQNDSRASDLQNQSRKNLVALQQQAHRLAVADVQQAVLNADVTFYSVNPGGPSVVLNQMSVRAQNGMRTIADASGGTAFIPDGEKDLERTFQQVAAELRGQYLLQYYASAENPPGAFRRIAVSVPTQPQSKVRARQGYYSKKQ
jgi:Ca-activated chloride channel family protein